jgi:glycosyltransferase involved in cell wall biosynthesis
MIRVRGTLRLLLATDHYPPFIGGAHRQSRLLATRMVERGHQVTLVTPWHRGLPARAQDDGVEVRRIRQVRTAVTPLVRRSAQQHQPPFPDPISVWELRRLIAEFEPDVIHTYGWISFSVAAAIGRRRIPLLVSARDYGYFCATRTLVEKGMPCSGPAPLKCLRCASDYYSVPKGWVATVGVALSRPLLERKMTALHSVSSYVREVTVEHLDGRRGSDRKPVEAVIPSFQDDAGPGTVPSEEVAAWLERLPPLPFILFVGAFRKVKGLEILFEAYGRLASPPPLVLMGTFERDSPRGFPPGAIVLADVPHAAVMAAWDRAMFGVMPSLWPEPLGATVAEAMSRGRPVIGTRLGGHADMLDKRTGILVPQGDAAALAAAMSALIDDPDRRQALGRAARERAASFSATQVLPRFERVYEEAISNTIPSQERHKQPEP